MVERIIIIIIFALRSKDPRAKIKVKNRFKKLEKARDPVGRRINKRFLGCHLYDANSPCRLLQAL